jgi:hypothetical protein
VKGSDFATLSQLGCDLFKYLRLSDKDRTAFKTNGAKGAKPLQLLFLNRVYEILSHKRALTLPMIRRLNGSYIFRHRV